MSRKWNRLAQCWWARRSRPHRHWRSRAFSSPAGGFSRSSNNLGLAARSGLRYYCVGWLPSRKKDVLRRYFRKEDLDGLDAVRKVTVIFPKTLFYFHR